MQNQCSFKTWNNLSLASCYLLNNRQLSNRDGFTQYRFKNNRNLENQASNRLLTEQKGEGYSVNLFSLLLFTGQALDRIHGHL